MSDVQPASALRFIVKYSGKYYLTQELWEFDPSVNTSKLQANQAFWLSQIQALYDSSADKADGAVHIAGGQVCEASQINNGGGLGAAKP